MADSLKLYRAKRNFGLTREPESGGEANEDAPAFVIQKHWASRLHYDLRLELDGAMKSWAVPKGPSYDPKDKRMAVQVEDHPIAYNQFEGEIPKGEYGAGKVIIWDEGTWEPLEDPRKGLADGNLKFEMHGRKMLGKWALIRMKGRGTEKQPAWLLIKEKDAFVKPASEFSVVDELPDSVVPLRENAGDAESRKESKEAKDSKRNKAAAAGKATPAAEPSTPDDPPAAHEAPTTFDPHDPPGVAAELPDKLSPQLATLVDAVPRDAQDWSFEIKYDGYRLLARIDGEQVRLFTRNGHDWTHKLQPLAKALGRLPLDSAWLDGEIVMLDEQGVPQFQALQNAFDSSRTADIVYFLFDAPFLGGRDLRQEPLALRREALEWVMRAAPSQPNVRLSETFDAAPRDLLASACDMGLEGIIGKLRDSPYASRRAASWIKLKCQRRQEFVIGGYTEPKGGRVGLGSLLLGVHDESGALQYAGNVGTGFDDRTLGDLKERLDAIAAERSPFAGKTQHDRGAHWVRPELVAEVSFGEWTTTGQVRHSVFRGLREDKPARSIVREAPRKAGEASREAHRDAAQPPGTPARKAPTVEAKAASGRATRAPGRTAASPPAAGTLAGLKVTHPERVIDPSTGLTKLDLVRYYGLVGPLLVEHLKDRPVSLVRAPSGIKGQLFFQKHLESRMPGVLQLPQALDPDHPPYIEVPTVEAVLSAAQMNVVEFHTWNAVKSAIDTPDRMTFDMDPGEGAAWSMMLQATELVHVMLREIGLEAFLKTSGGKGLHVVVPVERHHDWDTLKAFSQAVVQHLARTIPKIFVAKSGPSNRVGRIYVDYLRNGFGATTASAWSARSRPGLGVSVPVAWDELRSLKSGSQWTIANIQERLDEGNRPWADYALQPVTPAMEALGFEATTPRRKGA